MRYYNNRDLMYAASIRAGNHAEFRQISVPRFEKLRTPAMPVRQSSGPCRRALGRVAHGRENARIPLLDPFIVACIGFLEWMPEDQLRHSRLAGIRSDKEAQDTVRE